MRSNKNWFDQVVAKKNNKHQNIRTYYESTLNKNTSSYELNKAILGSYPIRDIPIALAKGCKPDENTLNCALLTHYSSSLVLQMLDLGAKPNEDTLNFALLSMDAVSMVDRVLKLQCKPNDNSLNCALLSDYPHNMVERMLELKAQPNFNTYHCAVESELCGSMVPFMVQLGAKRSEDTKENMLKLVIEEIGNMNILKTKSILEVKKNVGLIFQSIRQHGLFHKLPDAINIIIAADTGNPKIHNEKNSIKIATDFSKMF